MMNIIGMMNIVVAGDGTTRCLYAELIDFASIGEIRIERASHVEPDAHGGWWADLSISRGPVLGPFASRSAALAAEARWLDEHCLWR